MRLRYAGRQYSTGSTLADNIPPEGTVLPNPSPEPISLIRLCKPALYRLVTARRRSLGQGNIFTGVCLSTGVGGQYLAGFPASITGHMTEGSTWECGGSASRVDVPPGGSASRGWGLHLEGVCILGGVCIWGLCLQGEWGLHPGVGGHPGGGRGSASRGVGQTPMGYYGLRSKGGRYASYWNAF